MISDAPPPVATYTYNGRNQIATTVVENGLFTATRGYDTAGRLTGVTNGTLDSTGYTLSADGRRTGITRNGSAETYGYDNARQVTAASLALTGGTHANAYTYDPAGNRDLATTNGVTNNYSANAVNEYFGITGFPVAPVHDNNGNATTWNVLPMGATGLVSSSFTWDINDQLATATNGSGDTATYQYDALGRRTKRVEAVGGLTTTTWFFTNGWNVELEHDGSAYTRRMTWGLDVSQSLQGAGGVGGLVMTEDLPSGGGAPVPHFPTYDGNGNITAWVAAAGSVEARLRYDAYGNLVELTDGSGTPISPASLPSNYGFSTKPQDRVTGLLYYGYRYYDPVTGRWPSRDPIEEEGGINLYGYVGNEGINKFDLLGLCTPGTRWSVRVVSTSLISDITRLAVVTALVQKGAIDDISDAGSVMDIMTGNLIWGIPGLTSSPVPNATRTAVEAVFIANREMDEHREVYLRVRVAFNYYDDECCIQEGTSVRKYGPFENRLALSAKERERLENQAIIDVLKHSIHDVNFGE